MRFTLDRRTLIGGALAAGIATPAFAQPRTRVILLGTKGGPTPSKFRAAPATALVIGRKLWLVDCGNGTPQQAARAGLALPDLERVFVTHNHSDHVADVAATLLLAWASGLKTPVTVHGPPPIGRIVRGGIDAQAYDIAVRQREEGRVALDPLIRVDERTRAGTVLRAGGVTVTSALVDHLSVRPAFAYRFDTPDRSIVISGDTAYSPALVALATGADVLIHEALYRPFVERMAGENAPTLVDHILRSHTATDDIGRVAAQAGVRKLVLSHLVPADPAITDAMWLDGVRRHFGGDTVVGRDLMEV